MSHQTRYGFLCWPPSVCYSQTLHTFRTDLLIWLQSLHVSRQHLYTSMKLYGYLCSYTHCKHLCDSLRPKNTCIALWWMSHYALALT